VTTLRYFGSICPYCSPVSGGGGGFTTTPQNGAVLNKRQPGDSPQTTE